MKCAYIFAVSGANPSRRTLYAKHITRISFLALLLVIPPGLTAQEQPVNKSGLRFSIGASLGLLHGQGEEIVYMDAKTDNKWSQLLWDSKPLGYAGVDVGIDWKKPGSRWGFFMDGTFKFGFPGASGVMEDRDWDAVSLFEIDNPKWLTNYSEHDNRTDSALLIDADLGMSFRLSESFLLKTYLVYTYMSFSWTSSGGSFLYPAGGHWFEEPTGTAVTYQQSWHIISPALAFYGKFNRYFDIELSLKASPFIWCVADDNHHITNIHYTDTMEYGFFIEPGLVFSYTPQDYFSLSLSVS
ncbi:MAG: omptin family outer membrane protease [Treponema sp.]|jgi:outer membrane protease|nr:omptin family outer membrane protease [Treponema sp.]